MGSGTLCNYKNVQFCRSSSLDNSGWLRFNVPFHHKYGYIRDDLDGSILSDAPIHNVILFVRLFSDAISTAPGPIMSIKQIRRLIVLLVWGKENSILWFDYATPLRTLFLDGHRQRGHVRQTIVCERHELCGTRSIVRVSLT